MRRSFFSLTLFALLALQPLVGHGQPQPPASGPAPERQVSSRADPCLRLRTGASLERSILECLNPGTRLRVLGDISGWSRVQLPDGTDGWVDSGYLEALPAAPGPRRQAGPPVSGPRPAAAPASAARPADDLHSQIEALEGQLQAMSALRAATEERLRKTVAAAEQAQVEAGRLSQQVRELEREGERAGGDRAEQLAVELTAGRARIVELEQALAAAESQLLRAAELNAEQERRIEALDAAVASGRAGEAELRQALETAEERAHAAEDARDRQGKRVDELTGRLDAATKRPAVAERPAQPAARPEPPPGPPITAPVQVREPIAAAPDGPIVAAPESPGGAAPKPPGVSVRQPMAVAEEKAAEVAPEELAPAAPAAPPAAEPPVPATDAAIDTVRAWAAAWSDQRVDDYLAFYAARFRPPDGLGRGEWEAQRLERLSRPGYIRVTISAVNAERSADGTVRATFRQDYASDTFADTVTKVLILSEEDGAWRIVSEQATP